jgi:hypothetical protein
MRFGTRVLSMVGLLATWADWPLQAYHDTGRTRRGPRRVRPVSW